MDGEEKGCNFVLRQEVIFFLGNDLKINTARKNTMETKKCASPESNRGPNDGNVGFYH